MKPPYLHSALLTSLVVVQVSTNTANGSDCPGEFWADLPPGQPGLDGGLLEKARDYALTGGGSGIVIHRGKAVMRWEDQRRTYDLKSTSKSIGGTVLGLAMKDGFVRLDDKAAEIHPEFAPPLSPLRQAPSSRPSGGRPKSPSFASPKAATTGRSHGLTTGISTQPMATVGDFDPR